VRAVESREALSISEGDVSAAGDRAARSAGVVAWDIETSGLDWRADRIATCQLFVPGHGVELIRVESRVPIRLRHLLCDGGIAKVFHHAAFDLRFMRHHWDAVPQRIGCTKVAAKLLEPSADPGSHSLKPLVERCLGVILDKGEQRSDWFAELSDSQLEYAAADVRYLLPLLRRLSVDLRARGLEKLAERCFEHIPTRVELEVGGYGDVFAY
jgi:ribonuclease D